MESLNDEGKFSPTVPPSLSPPLPPSRYSVKLWRTFSDLFNCMPVAAVVEDKIFCMHGGLSPELRHLSQVESPPSIPPFLPSDPFNCMSVAFCMHGGLSPGLRHLVQVSREERERPAVSFRQEGRKRGREGTRSCKFLSR